MSRIGLGLIGVGRHGERYARHMVQDLPEVELVGLARRDRAEAERQAAAFGCRAFPDVEALLADPAVQGVAVVVPPIHHPDLVERAAAHRKPVLLEKPAAVSVADGRRMQAAVRAAGIPVMTAQTMRYNGVVRALLAEREGLGPIHAVRLGQRFEPSPLSWVDDPELAGGGILLHTGVHSFDLVRHLTGLEPRDVFCRTSRVGDVRLGNNFAALFTLADGAALASVSGCRATRSRSGAIEIAGERGQLVGDHVANTAFRVEGRAWTPLALPEDLPTVREILRDFVAVVEGSASPPITLEDGLQAAAMAEAAARSAATGRPEPVERML